MCYQLKRLQQILCRCVTRTRSQLKAVTRKRVSRYDRHRFQEKIPIVQEDQKMFESQ